MDMKIIAILAVVAVAAVGGAAAVFVMNDGGGDDKSGEKGDAPIPADASQIAAAFSASYSGFFGENYYLADGFTKDSAKAYYPNGSTSGYGSSDNYLTIKVMASESEAKSEFETNKTDYSAQIGRNVMGSEVKGTEVKGSLDAAIGYYNNFNMGTPSVYIYYTGYYSTLFFESYTSLKNTSLTNDSDVKAFADAIFNAIKNPVSTDKAKKYVAPPDDVTPTPSYTGVALKCYNFTDKAKSIGSSNTEYAMTSDSNAMSAKLQTSDEKYYVEMKIVAGGAKDTYDTAASTVSAKVGTTVMGANVIGVTEKTGADNGTGYYYNAAMGSGVYIMEYVCYSGNYYAHMNLRSATQFTDETAAAAAKDLIAALAA